MSSETATIDFEKMDGLVPGIVQDARTGEVLMLGFLESRSAMPRRWKAAL